MPDREKTIEELDRITSVLFDSLKLLKEQNEWITEIADATMDVVGSGMHELTDYEQGKRDGLAKALEIITKLS